MSIATVASMIEVLGLRRGPQDLPANRGVLVFRMGVSLLSGVLAAAPSSSFPRMPGSGPGRAGVGGLDLHESSPGVGWGSGSEGDSSQRRCVP